jgi:hypothetical protein
MKLIYWVTVKNAKQKAAKEGTSKLYIDHIKMLCDIVISLGKIPVMWADIALKHPEALKLLPSKQFLLIGIMVGT